MVLLKNRNWSREELFSVLKLYCITPFGRIHSSNPEIIAAAKALDRTPSAVALKMTNFASLDPTIERAGMKNVSKLDEEVWNDFFQNMDAYLENDSKNLTSRGLSEEPTEFIRAERLGHDVMRLRNTRTNQDFFRATILASYDNKCALTGIDARELLVASHIVPWSVDTVARTDPRNGICLNALHDRAFDRGLMTFDETLAVRYSNKLPVHARDMLEGFGRTKIRVPSKFAPDERYLHYHRTHCFIAD